MNIPPIRNLVILIKLNIDGAFKATAHQGGIGGVIKEMTKVIGS